MRKFYDSRLVDSYLSKHICDEIDFIHMDLELEKYERLVSVINI